MERIKLNKGDDAWVGGLGLGNKLTKGKVVEVVHLEGYSFEHYIIEIKTIADPLVMIRSGTLVSDAADKPLGTWRHDPNAATRELRDKIKKAGRNKKADPDEEIGSGEQAGSDS